MIKFGSEPAAASAHALSSSSETPLCAQGILDPGKLVCCPNTCGKCGGRGCSSRGPRCCTRKLLSVAWCAAPEDVGCRVGPEHSSGAECWPAGLPLEPRPLPLYALRNVSSGAPTYRRYHRGQGVHSGYGVDVLQVVAEIDCVVAANVAAVHALYFSPNIGPDIGTSGVHAIVTPDLEGCARLAALYNSSASTSAGRGHVRCVQDRHVFRRSRKGALEVSLDSITRGLEERGPEATRKGAAWYFQQVKPLTPDSTSPAFKYYLSAGILM